jgi:hypothetical protein
MELLKSRQEWTSFAQAKAGDQTAAARAVKNNTRELVFSTE